MSPATIAAEPLDILVDAIEQLALAHHIESLGGIVCAAARRATAADGATFAMREAGSCAYAEEDAMAPLWKGTRFPLEDCLSGWAIRKKAPVAIDDVRADDRAAESIYGTTFVESLLVVPIHRVEPVGAIGIYWAEPHLASRREIGILSALANSTAISLEQVRAAERMRHTIELAQSDRLTGLPTRRAWNSALSDALEPGPAPVSIVMADLDRFKRFNEEHGHPAGDGLLREVGTSWRDLLRTGDLLARYDGDGFAVLLPGADISAAMEVGERMREAVVELTRSSFGIAQWDGRESPATLIGRAGEALNRAKLAGGNRVGI